MRLFYALTFFVTFSYQALAAPQVLLDAELQDWVSHIAEPLFKATHFPPQSVAIHILIDDEVNAFATPGNHIFFNTGLILRAENTSEVRGVLAHELGHIQSNHLFQRYQDINYARFSMLAGALLGLGAAAAGSPDGAIAGILGGQAYGQSHFLKHSRTQEREADNHAMETLQKSGYSMKGMVSFFTKLRNDAMLTYTTPPAHLLTHPLPAERLNTLTTQASEEPSPTQIPTQTNIENFNRIKAKVYAYTHTPSQTLRHYRGDTVPDKIAQTLAYVYQGRFQEASQKLDNLLKKSPKDPFLYELKGHIALDSGNIPEAEKAFKEAITLKDTVPLFHFHYARSLQSAGKQEQAVAQLRNVQHTMPNWPAVWYLLGTNLGQLQHFAESHLALAEYYLLQGDITTTRQQLKLADQYIDKNTEKRLLAQRAALKTALKKEEKNAPQK